MAKPDIRTSVRVAGSGLTLFQWKGKDLAMLQTIQDTSPQPVAAAVPVQAIDNETPKEIVTARAVGPGTLRLTFYETWDVNVWQKLGATGGALGDFGADWSLLDVLKRQLQLGSISCKKIIKLPDGKLRVKQYMNCVITDIDDSEQINISTMVLPKGITVQYTHAVHV